MNLIVYSFTSSKLISKMKERKKKWKDGGMDWGKGKKNRRKEMKIKT